MGAGAAGLIAARALADAGVDVVVFEEDSEIGVPEHCAGLFSISGLKRLGVEPHGRYVQNRVRGAFFRSPGGKVISVDAGREVAVVTSRSSFDKMLAEWAEKAGAEIIAGERVLDISAEGDTLRLQSERGREAEAARVLDAEGMGGALARRVLGRTSERKMWIPIIQLLVEGHGLDPNYVYLYFEEYLPEFFGYLVPIDGELGKLGVASRRNLGAKLRKFLSERFPGVKILAESAHAVYTGKPLEIDARWRVIPIGDAAGHVKATTGGGVIMGGMIAEKIARAVASQIIDGTLPEETMKEMKNLIGELKRIALAARMMRALPPKMFDKLFEAAEESGLTKEVPEIGDMDLQFSSLSKIVKRPEIVFRFLLKLFF